MVNSSLPKPPSSNSYGGMHPAQIFTVYPPQYRKCRTYGHRWPDEAGSVVWSYVAKGLLDRSYACERCGAQKTEHLNTHHERVAPSSIWYPRGYLTPRTGLVKQDFTTITYADEFAAANKRGAVRSLIEDN